MQPPAKIAARSPTDGAVADVPPDFCGFTGPTNIQSNPPAPRHRPFRLAACLCLSAPAHDRGAHPLSAPNPRTDELGRTPHLSVFALTLLSRIVPALICPWGPARSLVLLNTTHGRTGYSLPRLARAGIRHTRQISVAVIVPPLPELGTPIAILGRASSRAARLFSLPQRRLLQWRIGISLCKCSLCIWCAVGLMRPTVARGEAIADAGDGMASTSRSSPMLNNDARRRSESFSYSSEYSPISIV